MDYEHLRALKPKPPFLFYERQKEAILKYINNELIFNHTRFYAVTITPHDHHIDSVLSLHNAFRHMVQTVASATSIVYVFEQGDPPHQKLHAHGIICVHDVCKFTKFKRHPLYSFYCKPLESAGGWIEYILKDHPDKIYEQNCQKFDSQGHIKYREYPKRILMSEFTTNSNMYWDIVHVEKEED